MVWSVSNFIFLASAYEGRWPILYFHLTCSARTHYSGVGLGVQIEQISQMSELAGDLNPDISIESETLTAKLSSIPPFFNITQKQMGMHKRCLAISLMKRTDQKHQSTSQTTRHFPPISAKQLPSLKAPQSSTKFFCINLFQNHQDRRLIKLLKEMF